MLNISPVVTDIPIMLKAPKEFSDKVFRSNLTGLIKRMRDVASSNKNAHILSTLFF